MWASRLTKMCNRHLIIAFEADWYLRGVATFRHLTPPAGGVPHSTVISSHWTALIFDLTWTTWLVLPPMKAGNSRVIDVIVASIFYHSQLSLTHTYNVYRLISLMCRTQKWLWTHLPVSRSLSFGSARRSLNQMMHLIVRHLTILHPKDQMARRGSFLKVWQREFGLDG